MITYPKHVQDALQELNDKGFAVIIFTPKELDGTNPTIVEECMIAAGWEAINQNKDPNTPDFDWENEQEDYPN